MSEQNLLNSPGDWSLGPDYGYKLHRTDRFARARSRSGNSFVRGAMVVGREYDLVWSKRMLATVQALQAFEAQYEDGFFTYYDGEEGRYFTGAFVQPLQFSPAGHDQFDVTGYFAELPGLAMYSYPNDWVNFPRKFYEERDDYGNDRPAYTGVWTYAANANAHGGAEATNPNNNATDKAQLLIFGYGFRLWARKDVNLGILNVSVTELDGTASLAPTAVDLYAAAPAAAAAIYTKYDLKLSEKIVTLQATNTKNVASAGNTILFDAIEVMR